VRGSAASLDVESDAALDPGASEPEEGAPPAPAASIPPVAIHPPTVGRACGDLATVTDAAIACCTDVLGERALDGAIWSEPEPVPELGVCDGRDARDLFYATVRDVIVPRLADLGLPAREAWERRLRA
jgi:hypothetical protein